MSTAIGRAAEAAAAQFLIAKGCELLAANWRTRWCEIDLVARRGSAIYFVEVKYRASGTWGTGLDYITPAKLRQMHFAAQFWCAKNNWQGDYRLAALGLAGVPARVVAAVSSIE